MGECINKFKNAEIDAGIIIGGAPVNQEYASKIGADGYSSDAPGAIELAKGLVPVA